VDEQAVIYLYSAVHVLAQDVVDEQAVSARMPYVEWLVGHVVTQLDPPEASQVGRDRERRGRDGGREGGNGETAVARGPRRDPARPPPRPPR
jgi:hypothetical protein